MKRNQLAVKLNGKLVGILEQKTNGNMLFKYDITATQRISVSMPIQDQPYSEAQTDAYFSGLLPESETVKKIIGKKYGISSNNHFSLLKAIGYDCAGAISCHDMEGKNEIQYPFPLTGKIISDDQLYTHIKDLPRKPLFMDTDGLRLSLAGAQDKAAICLIDNQIALSENGCPTTHILKPSSQFEGMAENEYFCLRIAKQIGLPIPDIQLRQVKDITFLLIERYDRRINGKYVECIHQEDFCQALSIPSSKKYQNEGGPGFKDCFELIDNTAQPAIDRKQLVSALVFNYLIGNMDAHGKNFSLLHTNLAEVKLAPFYDMICTQVYPELTSKMAMKIGSKYESESLFPRHWEQLCHTISYRYLSMKDLIKEQADLILKTMTLEKNLLKEAGYDITIINKIIILVNNNIEKVLGQFSN